MGMGNVMRRILGLIAGVALWTGLASASLPTSSLNKTRLGTACAGAANSDLALQCWLTHNPNVAQAMVYLNISGQQTFSEWPVTLQDQMYGYFDQMVSWYDAGWPVVPQPQIFPTPVPVEGPDPSYGERYMTLAMGTQVYMGQVAAVLAGELTAQFPWSIAGYSPAELKPLLNQSVDYQLLWEPAVTHSGYYWQIGFSGSPANPSYVAVFFKVNHLLGSTAAETVALLYQWERQLEHFYVVSGYNTTTTDQVYTYFWGPNAPPIPASYVVNGTTYTGPEAVAEYAFQHYTAGCWGTQDFMSSMLKIMNIPVQRTGVSCGHATPVFPTAGVAMTHGDDPYDARGYVSPSVLASPTPADYLISLGKYDQLFPAGQSGSACLMNVAVQPANIAIQYGSDYLMNAYCQDQASNATEANGQVYAALEGNYSLQQLQSMQLWQILQVKQIVTNWCATHPQ